MLTIELVPKTVWFKNLRSEMSQAQWDHIRKDVYKKAGYVCEICGGKGPKWPVECHEIWKHDDEKRIQSLTGLIGLCPSCHQVKHMGLARVKGQGLQAQKHLEKVNSWTREESRAYIIGAFTLWEERSGQKWDLDISWIYEHYKELFA